MAKRKVKPTIQDIKSIAEFHRVVMNYIKMKAIK